MTVNWIHSRGVMVCDECGGTCPEFTDNYDDVMHLEGCPRVSMLGFWKKHDTLLDVSMKGTKCEYLNQYVRDVMPNHLDRYCPAFNMLFSVLGRELIYLQPSAACARAEECYREYYAEYEDEVLSSLE